MIDTEWTEFIDGVKIVHTGCFCVECLSDGYGTMDKMTEIVKIFDAKTGYRLYMNCDSVEKAKEFVQQLEAEGLHPIIGPEAPWINGKSVTQNNSDYVGVYLAD